MAWSRSGALLAIGRRDGTIQILENVSSNQCQVVLTISAHAAAVTSVTWSRTLLATGSLDGSARLWNLSFDVAFRKLLSDLNAFSFGEDRGASPLDERKRQLAKYEDLVLRLKDRIPLPGTPSR
jgi:WD40 repeat protein